jgi:beta-glucanase (GH16 family)
MGRGTGRVVSGVLVALAVVAAFFIVKAKASTEHPLADTAVAAGPTMPVPSSSPYDVSATPPASLISNMKLSFDASFSGAKLNTSQWSTCYPWVPTGKGCTNFGNGSREEEWYLPSQDRVYGGALHIVAQHKATPGTNRSGAPKQYECRSGMVTTYKSFRFEYGYVKIVARIPYSKGLWSALWLAAANLRWPPEIDIMEHVGTTLQYSQYLHRVNLPRFGKSEDVPDLSTGWHDIGLLWTKGQVAWYVDGIRVASTTKGVPQQPMYFIANIADDASGPGSCSGTMLVKSVKIWTPKKP